MITTVPMCLILYLFICMLICQSKLHFLRGYDIKRHNNGDGGENNKGSLRKGGREVEG